MAFGLAFCSGACDFALAVGFAFAVGGAADDDDDDVKISGIKPNNDTDMEFWKEQSGNELRAQLKLRYPDRFNKEWAFKERPQLLEIITELIKDKW